MACLLSTEMIPTGMRHFRVALKGRFYDAEEAAAGESFVIYKASGPSAGAETDPQTAGSQRMPAQV
jgi:hypothetical protein